MRRFVKASGGLCLCEMVMTKIYLLTCRKALKNEKKEKEKRRSKFQESDLFEMLSMCISG